MEREITSCPLATLPAVFGALSDRLLIAPTPILATCTLQEFRAHYNQSTIMDSVLQKPITHKIFKPSFTCPQTALACCFCPRLVDFSTNFPACCFCPRLLDFLYKFPCVLFLSPAGGFLYKFPCVLFLSPAGGLSLQISLRAVSVPGFSLEIISSLTTVYTFMRFCK